MTEGVSPELGRFIERFVPSLGHLEALLLLRREAPQTFTAAETGKRLYIAVDVAAAQLAELAAWNFLRFDAESQAYRYGPAEPDAERLIDELARLYQERRVTVITLIYSKPNSNVKTFADAFRLRKEP
jgi:hypothetical protein